MKRQIEMVMLKLARWLIRRAALGKHHAEFFTMTGRDAVDEVNQLLKWMRVS